MPILRPSFRSGLAAALAVTVLSAAERGPGTLSFNDDIQPILSEYCFHCHGPDAASRKGELRLDRAEFAFLPRKEGAATIVPGDPAASLLIRKITSVDPAQIMPPPEAHKPLKASQIALLRRWVEEGAVYQEHWAFVPPVRPPLPEVRRPDWVRTPLDHFVLAGLERAGFGGAPEADRHALVRRVTFDLTGLPPSPEEIGDFLSDRRPDAYERVVDRLLASPRYGEHRARYWLDAVRYGDTNGEHADNLRTAWPYRDYVLKAFNENKPFDQFAVEQLAGDLLPPANFDHLVASHYNRLHTTTNEGGSVVEEIYLHKLRDRTQTTAAVFLGLTMGCAACHDHRFDPITQTDYYRLSAFFNNMPDSVYDANQAFAYPAVSLPPPEKRAEAERVLAAKAEVERRLAARTGRVDVVEAWLSGPAGPQAVSPDALRVRFRLDEGGGNRVRNVAPGADPEWYTLGGGDHSWGGSTRPLKHWTGLRVGVQTTLTAARIGDFERDQAFTVGGWFLPRERSGTTAGAFVSRMENTGVKRGWDLYWQAAPTRRATPAATTKKSGGAAAKAAKEAQQVDDDVENRPEPEGFLVANLVHEEKKNALTVRSKRRISRKEWVHLAFTYDGSGRAAGVRLYIDGEPQEAEVIADNLTGTIRTGAPWQLARRAGGEASPETGFQDVRLYGRALSPDEVRRITHEDLAAEVARRPRTTWSEDDRQIATDFYFRAVDGEAIALRRELAQLETQFQRATAGGVVMSIAKERESRAVGFVLGRGVYDAIRERVEAGVPAVLPPLPAGAPRNRLGFARWLVAPENPLTARVIVNRMWQELFGIGIVETPENFGVAGARPANRPLLDWLAVDFRESGWDVKRFYRQAVLSAAYRQSARIPEDRLAADPANRLISRGPRFRLDGEMIRDQALAASGLLVERLGGPGVRPYQAEGIWEAVSVQGQSNTRDYVPDKGDGLYRRSVYTFWKRSAPNPVLQTFDAPKRDVCTLRRDRTNTPLQALVTENATDYLEAARQLATGALRMRDAGEGQRLDAMALRLLNRPLPEAQRRVLQRSLARFRADFANPDDARAFLSYGESPVDPAFPSTELAAWTLVASQLLNSDFALNK